MLQTKLRLAPNPQLTMETNGNSILAHSSPVSLATPLPQLQQHGSDALPTLYSQWQQLQAQRIESERLFEVSSTRLQAPSHALLSYMLPLLPP